MTEERNQQILLEMVMGGAPSFFQSKVVSPETIDEFLEMYKPMLESDELIQLAREKIEENFYIEMEGELSVLKDDEDHEEWFNEELGVPLSSDDAYEPHYWDHYKKYLTHKGTLNAKAIDEIDIVTNKILARLVNPKSPTDFWDKRGLVMGSVQSGKTGNYTGLIAKAIDAGYKFIVVLAGIHNNLRAQTQLRINDELLGYDMKRLVNVSATKSKRVGVGAVFRKHKGLSIQTLTTSEDKGDFSKTLANSVNPILDGNHTYVLVIKKHSGVMKNLIEWIQNYGDADDKKRIRNVPMLLIDDECDQASIDTKKHKEHDEDGNQLENPTATNGRIRTLLNTFAKSAYVGYTATPFANIFIKSEGEHAKLGVDLFPKNFIFSLKRPSSYVGPEEFFGLKGTNENTSGLPLQRNASDAKDIYLPRHKMDLVVTELPKTLKKAMMAYLLSLAARKLRKTSSVHSSMLIHVSRFTNVQKQTFELIKKQLKEYHNLINTKSEKLEEFKQIWDNDFSKTTNDVLSITSGSKKWGKMQKHSWGDIRKALAAVVSRVRPKELNGGSKDVLDYKDHEDGNASKSKWEEKGLHTIVVGGNKLSRGLTLEGLSVSYYLRSSNMYDTLMQMGRWFGYRKDYLDLCRIYSTNEIFNNFGLIATAEKDLREQFDTMMMSGKTPRDFGLYVLQSPGNLVVTNRGKSRHSIDLNISFGGSGPEITQFIPSQRAHNWNVLEKFIDQMDKQGTRHSIDPNLHWQRVPKDLVASFFKDYSVHGDQIQVINALHQFISKQDHGLIDEWDVVCVKLKSDKSLITKPIRGYEWNAVKRAAKSYDANKMAIKRIGAPSDELLDFTDEKKQEIRASLKAEGRKSLTGAFIRNKRPSNRGLLLLYMIASEDGEHPYGTSKDRIALSTIPYYGFLASFPSNGDFKTTRIRANTKFMELG